MMMIMTMVIQASYLLLSVITFRLPVNLDSINPQNNTPFLLSQQMIHLYVDGCLSVIFILLKNIYIIH